MSLTISISRHAIDRYRSRVDRRPCRDTVRCLLIQAVLLGPLVRKAAGSAWHVTLNRDTKWTAVVERFGDRFVVKTVWHDGPVRRGCAA